MRSHIKTLGILHIIYGSISLILGLLGLGVFGALAAVVGFTANPEESVVVVPILGLIGTAAAILGAILGLPHVIAGYFLMNYRPWARILTVILSVIGLLNVPIGTLLGAYGLWVLFSTEGSRLFEGPGYRAA